MNIVIFVSLFHNCVFGVFLNIDKMHNSNAQLHNVITCLRKSKMYIKLYLQQQLHFCHDTTYILIREPY